MTVETITESVLTADEVLANWQGHRRVTRRTIEAFPEDKLFQFSVGGMRPFAELVSEFIRMAVPIVDVPQLVGYVVAAIAAAREGRHDGPNMDTGR